MERPAGARARRILIVDDDRLLAQTLREMLADFAETELTTKLTVDVVVSGREAERRLTDDADYDVVLCDLGMPGVDGLTLYEGLVARQSPLAHRFVLATGGAFTPAAASAVASHAIPCLQKPFDAQRLAAMLRPFFAPQAR